ncbi:MAG: hypothetical protein ATN35_11670 [Epulopiscium sp. Nele67-Bin004]|nr:MAG: hypothetical protein ATN35_11670 [Epulopiscium sp. Nele67-Bin004]
MTDIQLQEIEYSIEEYQSTILSDLNFTLKIVDHDNSCTAKLTTWAGLQLIIETPSSLLSLDLSKKYTFNFFTSDSLYLANVVLINKIQKTNSMFYVGKIVSPVHKKQQRNFFRLPASIPIEFLVIPEVIGDTICDIPSEPISAHTMDISAGGLKFLSDVIIDAHSKIVVEFTLQKTVFNLIGKVLPSYEENMTRPYVYRIAFVDISTKTQEQLLNHILLYQRQLISAGKNPKKPTKSTNTKSTRRR